MLMSTLLLDAPGALFLGAVLVFALAIAGIGGFIAWLIIRRRKK
ncbi:MAG: hypothetical protein Fur0041_09430 [Bacteroidia bacterium]